MRAASATKAEEAAGANILAAKTANLVDRYMGLNGELKFDAIARLHMAVEQLGARVAVMEQQYKDTIITRLEAIDKWQNQAQQRSATIDETATAISSTGRGRSRKSSGRGRSTGSSTETTSEEPI